MATTEKGRRTRDRIIEAAADLMHARGMNAVSAGDIMRASGSGKGQFYQHFDGRDALVEEVLRRHAAFVGSMPRIEDWASLEQWMTAHVSAQAATSFERGCPVGTAAYALRGDQDTLRQVIASAFEAMETNITQFLLAEKIAGRFSKKADPRKLALFAIATVQGGLLLNLLHRTGDPFEASSEAALDHLKSYRIDPQ